MAIDSSTTSSSSDDDEIDARHQRERATRPRADLELEEVRQAMAVVLGLPPAALPGINVIVALRTRAKDDPAVVLKLTWALRRCLRAPQPPWWSVRRREVVRHRWLDEDPCRVCRLQLLRVMYDALDLDACAEAANTAGLTQVLLQLLRDSGDAVPAGQARWTMEAGCVVRCLAALSGHSNDAGAPPADYVPLVCKALRRGGEGCTTERLAEAIALQLHAVNCLANHASTDTGRLEVAASDALEILEGILGPGSDPGGVLEGHARELLDALRKTAEPAPPVPKAKPLALRGGFGVPLAKK